MEIRKKNDNYHKKQRHISFTTIYYKVYNRFLQREPFMTVGSLECLNNPKCGRSKHDPTNPRWKMGFTRKNLGSKRLKLTIDSQMNLQCQSKHSIKSQGTKTKPSISKVWNYIFLLHLFKIKWNHTTYRSNNLKRSILYNKLWEFQLKNKSINRNGTQFVIN